MRCPAVVVLLVVLVLAVVVLVLVVEIYPGNDSATVTSVTLCT